MQQTNLIMKTTSKIIRGLTLALFVATIATGRGQEAVSTQTDFSSINVSWDTATDEQVELHALESASPIPFANIPKQRQRGTLWSAQHAPGSRAPWPPLPGNMLALPVWPLGDDVYLLDDRDLDYPALSAAMSAGSVSSPTGFSGPLFDTNALWLEITSVDLTNQLAYVLAHNTDYANQYQLMSKTNLLQPHWTVGEIKSGDSGVNTTAFSPFHLAGSPQTFFDAQQANVMLFVQPSSYHAIEPQGTDPGQAAPFYINSTVATTDLTMHYTLSGTAGNGVDYTNLSGVVTVPAYMNVVEIDVQPKADNLLEGIETVILTLVPGDGFLIDPAAQSATNFIEDNIPSVADVTAPVGLDYYAPSNSLIVSYNYSSGSTYNFARIYTNLVMSNSVVVTNVVVANWSGIHDVLDEVKLATVKTNAAGFTKGDLYFGSNTGIGWLSANGSVSNLNWCVLTNATETNALLLRGSLCVDQTGVFGNQIIAVTSDSSEVPGNKGVWRVNASHQPTLLANINTPHLEGVTTLPNNTTNWGPWAGKIITGDEDAQPNPLIYTIATNGAVTTNDTTALIAGGIHPEDFDIIPPNQSLYACDFGANKIVKFSAEYFTNYVGDLLITDAGENVTPNVAKLFIVHWDAATTNFVTRKILYGSSSHLEHVTFAPIDLPTQ